MAKKWDDHTAANKKLAPEVSKFSHKVSKALIADFINSYRKIELLEDNLPAALIKARDNGVSGDGLAAFKKDKGFADAFKALDKEVDTLWAVQVKCKNLANEALSTALDLKTLTEHIDKDISAHEKDLRDAEDALKKHEAKVKAGKATVSPAMLKAIDLQRKDVAAGKVIEKHCATALEKAKKDKQQSEPEMKAVRMGIEALKKVQIALGKEHKKHLDLIRKSKHAKDYERQFKDVEEAFLSAVKAQRVAVTAIAKLP